MFTPLLSLPSYGQTKVEIKELRDEIIRLKKEVREARKNSDLGVDDRLTELEISMKEAMDKLGSRAIVQAFEGIKLDIGGFLHTAYTYVEGDENSVGSFNRQNFELLIGAEITDSWSAFFAGGYLREANDPFVVGTRQAPDFDTNNRNPLIIGWSNYQQSDLFNVRLGRMITPHGIINIEHFPATLYDPEQPQFLRPFGGNTLFPNFSTGIQTHGKHFGERINFEYAVYATNAPGTGGVSNTEELFGFRIAVSPYDSSVELGLNYSDSYRGSTNSDYTMQGVDLALNFGFFQLKTEYYQTDEETGGDREAYYVQPIVHFSDKWSSFVRYDFLGAGDQLGESTENMIGLNYTPSYNVRLRVTYTDKEFTDGYTDSSLLTPLEDASASIVQFSGTFSF